jgi:hypothetical protein
VELEIAVSMAEPRTEKELIRTYVRLDSRTSIGTKLLAKLLAAEMKTMLIMQPRTD